MATMRHFCLNLIRNIKGKTSLKVKLNTMGKNDDYLFNSTKGLTGFQVIALAVGCLTVVE